MSFSTNLVTWQERLTNVVLDSQFAFTDAESTTLPRRFYRAATRTTESD